MAKQLSQITFEFGAEEPVPLPVKKTRKAADLIIEKPKAVVLKKTGAKRGRKALKDADINIDTLKIPDDETLFKKQYYPIGEVAIMFRENQSLIRYWETEFDILKPKKNRKGDRHFRPIDIKNLVLIYDLLRRRKFTIEGAKDFLRKNKNAEEKFAMIQSLQQIREFLLELKASL
jgi:DNA-binding transcriptional MerR regulator